MEEPVMNSPDDGVLLGLQRALQVTPCPPYTQALEALELANRGNN